MRLERLGLVRRKGPETSSWDAYFIRFKNQRPNARRWSDSRDTSFITHICNLQRIFVYMISFYLQNNL